MVQYKPSFGGGIIAVIKSKTDPDMATVRKGMFKVMYEPSGKPVKEFRSNYEITLAPPENLIEWMYNEKVFKVFS